MISKFLETHKHVILGLSLLGVILVLGNWYFDRVAKDANVRLQMAQSVLQTQKEANDKLAGQNQQAQQQYQVLLGQVNAENARLSGEILQLSQTLATRQKQDAVLPMPELSARWETLLSLPPQSIISTESGLQVSPDSARATVSSLESLPVLKQQLADETTVADNKSKALDSSQALVVGLQNQISGLNVQLTDTGKVCDARVSVAKKSKWKYFKAGVIAGFVGGLVIGHKIP